MSLKPVSPITSWEQIVVNVEQFNKDLEDVPNFYKHMTRFFHWYYIPSKGLFGPNKFIGYEDMTAERYNKGRRTMAEKQRGFPPKTGGVTTAALSNWFRPTEDKSLYSKLEALHQQYDKKPRKDSIIYVPTKEEY